MLELYSQLSLKKLPKLIQPFNIIRSFDGSSKSCAIKPCSKVLTLKSRIKQFKFYQVYNLKEMFQFNLNYIEQEKAEKLIKSELDLKFNFKKIFQRLDFTNSNNYNELKIDLLLNGKTITLLEINSTLNGIKSKLSRIQLYKINMNKLIRTHYNKKQLFNLNLSLRVKFKSTVKYSLLNDKLIYLKDLLVKQPFIVSYSDDGSAKSEQPEMPNMPKIKNLCNKKQFTIDFNELGWNQVIIEPKYLNSFYCSGSCDLPLDDNSKPTSYAILISLASRLKRFNYLPKVCCKPDRLASKMFLFVDELDNVVIKKVNDIIVESCSCQ